MKVELLHNTPLWVASKAIRKCWASEDKSDTEDELYMQVDNHMKQYGMQEHLHDLLKPKVIGPKDKELIDRIGNKEKHQSVKNHINYTFEISGITTKTLLALTRHDIGVEFSVQSTRYTTKKCVKNGTASYTESKNDFINKCLEENFMRIKQAVEMNIDNDEISMLLPQAWKYNLVCTFSMSALQHFLNLRHEKSAGNHPHWDIRTLAEKLYESIPEDHKYLFIFKEETVEISKETLKELENYKYMHQSLSK